MEISETLEVVRTRNNHHQAWIWALGLGLLALLWISLFFGRYPALGFIQIEQILHDDLAQRLILNLRFPRLLTAALLGATLSAAGMVFQLLFNNPLVEPGFLGVSQGAAFGAGLCIVFFGGSALLTQTFSAVFAFVGLAASVLLAHRLRYGGWILRLVLAGIAVSAFFSAGLGLLKYMADPLRQLPELTFWLLGSLASITWVKFSSVLPFTILGLFVLYIFRWRINILSLTDDVAFSLGANPSREKTLLMVAAVLPTAAMISVAGMVGWVGLITPHLARRLFGSDARFSLPAAMLIGALFTVFCDDISRTVMAGEIPLGILTSMLGAATFLILMTAQPIKVKA
ncbi:MAG: FecCD family ABC transporter permease [Anaerolineales bacterium]